MFKVEADIFVYHDDLQRVGECRYDIAIQDNDRWLVVFTELAKNPGPSITNAIEHIIEQFCKLYNLNFVEVDFFERYSSHPNDLDAIFYHQTSTGEFEVAWSRVPPFESEPILKLLK